MKTTDKFLIGIVSAVILLVGAAFAVALMRPKPAYREEDTPEGVAHNYLLAIQQKDYERAYGYLSPGLANYPDSDEEFENDVQHDRYRFNNLDSDVTLEVESSEVTGERSTVIVRRTNFYQGGLFSSNSYTARFEMRLRRENGAWRIVDSDEYWVYCWSDPKSCP